MKTITLTTLLIITIFLFSQVECASSSKLKKPNSRVVNTFKKLDLDCRIKCNLKETNQERDPDSPAENCRRSCINPECNKLYFGNYELEDGEVDSRETLFTECVHKQIDSERKKLEQKGPTSDASDTLIAILPLVVFVCIIGIVLYAI